MDECCIPSLHESRTRHTLSRREHMLTVPHWHVRRLPSSRLRDRGEIDIQREQLLRCPDPNGMPANIRDFLLR